MTFKKFACQHTSLSVGKPITTIRSAWTVHVKFSTFLAAVKSGGRVVCAAVNAFSACFLIILNIGLVYRASDFVIANAKRRALNEFNWRQLLRYVRSSQANKRTPYTQTYKYHYNYKYTRKCCKKVISAQWPCVFFVQGNSSCIAEIPMQEQLNPRESTLKQQFRSNKFRLNITKQISAQNTEANNNNNNNNCSLQCLWLINTQ